MPKDGIIDWYKSKFIPLMEYVSFGEMAHTPFFFSM